MSARRTPLLLAAAFLAMVAATPAAAALLPATPAPHVRAASTAVAPGPLPVPRTKTVVAPGLLPVPRTKTVVAPGPLPGPSTKASARVVVRLGVGVFARPSPVPVPKVTIPEVPGRDGKPGPVVSVPGVQIWDGPRPRVSVTMRPGMRPPRAPGPVPHVSIGGGSMCVSGPGGSVQVGECHSRAPRRPAPRARPRPARAHVPAAAPTPTPTPTPEPTVKPRTRVKQAEARQRRKSPLGTVLVMVVLVTAITSTTAVAFKGR